ncbi:MAG: extracellular solute-binding protein [Deltaproteobacteria bacterium]|nr:extracellular solute-binding protein [Deltaproteobacteria bacterium]
MLNPVKPVWIALGGVICGALAFHPAQAAQVHGLSLGAPLKYPAGFHHFAYANPAAPTGGSFSMSSMGSFDTLNPFSLKDRPPAMLDTLVFESLTTPSMDEAFAVYGLLAQSMEVAPNQLSVTFHLRPQARFSDGTPVTAQDVVFSFNTLRSPAAKPMYRFVYQDIRRAVAVDARTVRMEFVQKNRELALIAGSFPVFPQHVYGQGDFGKDFSTRAVGSGPYVVDGYSFGKDFRFRRNPAYWGWNLGVNRGRYNFDTLVVKYFRDNTAQLEGFKAGEFDFLFVNSSKQWGKDIAGEKWDKGWLVKKGLPHQNNAGMQGFVFNLRRSIFQDRRVREALSMGLDFEWCNRALFYGQYTQLDSYFDNTELAAEGLPKPNELALLNPLRKKLPQDVFTRPVEAVGKGFASQRERLREAQRLLAQAGWAPVNGVLTRTADGTPMRFTFLMDSTDFVRIVEPYLNQLAKLGVQGDIQIVDDAVFQQRMKKFDFDMTVGVFGQSLSPGNEQIQYWHSSTAQVEDSSNWAGIQDPAVDALVERLIRAENRRDLVTATRALDRVLWHQHYVVPNWFIGYHRVTYRNRFGSPTTLPLYYNPLTFITYWWEDPALTQKLARAQAEGLEMN